MQLRLADNGTTWGQPRFPSPDDLDRWRSYLDEVAAAGFDGLEHMPLMTSAVDPPLLAHELEHPGLALAGLGLYGALETPDGLLSLEEQLAVGAAFVNDVGADYIFIIDAMYADPLTGEVNRPVELDEAGWATMIEHLSDLNARSHNLCGLPLLLHPHQYSHIDTPEQIERFLTDTDPERISILFDVGQYSFSGADPVAFYRRQHERIDTLHLKNVRRRLLTGEEGWQVQLTEAGAFADLTEGGVDFEGRWEALDEHGYEGWATVEMERLPEMPGEPVDVASKAVGYLHDLGYGSG